jgi:hypothetical protein
VERLAEVMPKSGGAADRLRRCADPAVARGMAGDLMQALAAVECNYTVGGAAGVPAPGPGRVREACVQDALALARITDGAPA